MTLGELIKVIKAEGNIRVSKAVFVIDLLETSFGYECGSTYLTSDRVSKWMQRKNSGVNKWAYDAIKDGMVFDHASFINFLSSRTTKTWRVIQSAFREKDESERPLIDCETDEATVFWRSILWQFKEIVGLAQNDEDAPLPPLTASNGSSLPENLPRLLSAPFLFSPIYTKRSSNTSVYRSGYRDKSTVILSGKFESGKYLVISHGKALSIHADSISDVQRDMEDALYALLKAIGGSFPHKRIGVSSGHGEQVTAAGFNRAIKARFVDDGIAISDTVVDAIALCDVFIIGEPLVAYSEDEEDEVISHIANGGAVVFCSNGWSQKKVDNGAQSEITYLPVNNFGKTLGFKIERGLTGKFLCVGDKRLYFSPLRNASEEHEETDCSEEVSRLIAMANGGDSNAQWQLGLKYETGKDLPKDSLAALYWYKMSAFSGNAVGQHRLSRYYMGTVVQGVKQSGALTLAWLMASAEQCNKYAQGNLGHAYQRGLYGIAVDKEKAFAMIEASAKNGWAVSQIRLGKHYEELQDYSNAALWYTRAANNREISPVDLAEAKLLLALLFKSGNGVRRDVKKAALLLRESKEYGNDRASAELDMLESDLTAACP